MRSDPLPISPAFPWTKKSKVVNGLSMAYIDEGVGDSLVFLHGNPTSSYLWRNVIPHVQHFGRCIAPDLIGFGDSDKLPNADAESYRFVENRDYIDGLFDQLDLGDSITLIVHDWGSGLGFDWASRHPERVAAIAYMEANAAPRSWSQLSPEGRAIFQQLRTPDGERMALEENFFIERGLPGGVIRDLSPEEMTEYRRPFLEAGEGRRATLTWPREIPFDGEPADVHDIVAAYSRWLASSPIPKLLINVSDGDTLTGELLAIARSWPNQTEINVVGRHFAQEDSPDEIGEALANWLESVRNR